LDTRLANDDGRVPRSVALSGLGGAGKTSVAMEYAYRHLGGLRVAWQFACEDAAVLAAGFGELAAQLGTQELGGTRDPVASVHAVLAASETGWLLIFDNAADLASVQAFLPPAGPGRVLVTSRNPSWPPGQVLDVPVLNTEVAADFLVNRTDDADEQAAIELATELGGLPLALGQAVAHIQSSSGTLTDYLTLFRQRRPEMLARGQPAGYDSTIATTWSLAFAELEQSAPSAVGLLRLLAFCAPEAVPLRLLLQTRRGRRKGLRRPAAKLVKRLEDPLALADAVAALRRYSLVTPAGDGSVSVHRLVQTVTADQMPYGLRNRWHDTAAAVIKAAIPADASAPASWPACAALLPHARAALSLISPGMWQIAEYLGASGSYPAARDLSQRIADRCRDIYGPEDVDTLGACANLAKATGMAGDAAGARDQLAALLPIYERVKGPEYRLTLANRYMLGIWIGEAGDAAGARDQYAALLPIYERRLGPEHPLTLATRTELASWTGKAGDAAGARDQLAALLPIVERVVGPEGPGTLTTRVNLAHLTGEAGDAAGARDQDAALLPIYERVLGPEHPATLTIRGDLARWTGEAGDAAGARDQDAALLPIYERALGPEHPATLTIRGDLARWTGEAGDVAGARDQDAALLPIVERMLGPEHPATLTTRADLASWTAQAEDGSGPSAD
jgi:hypothetical protein